MEAEKRYNFNERFMNDSDRVQPRRITELEREMSE